MALRVGYILKVILIEVQGEEIRKSCFDIGLVAVQFRLGARVDGESGRGRGCADSRLSLIHI